MTTPLVSVGRGAFSSAGLFAACWCLVVTFHSAAAVEKPVVDPLITAVRLNDAAAWQALLATKSDVKVRDAAGNTALHFAALNQDAAAVRALLAAGAEPDAKNAAGATPLLYGAGSVEIVRSLLTRGADANAASKLKITPLMAAVAHPDSYEATRLLIEAGADVHARRSSDIEVVLDTAVSGGDRRTIDLLLAHGAGTSPKAVSVALATAALEGDMALVTLLLERGGDPNYDAGFVGHSLNLALFAEHPGVARLLIAKGADLNLRSQRGHGTPPMVWSAYNQTGDATVARALVAAGVDVNVANDEGATALGYALRSAADSPLIGYLESAGAKSREPVRAKRAPARAVPPTPGERSAVVRERMPATLEILRRSSMAFLDNGFVQQSKCTSCHGQDLPAVAFELARARGFRIDDLSFGRQLAAQTSRWSSRVEFARQMLSPLPGAPVSVSYGLFGLRAAHYAPDDMTDALVGHLLRTQRTDGRWSDDTRRPPMEDGTLVATAWAALSIRDYAPAGWDRTAADALARSARWLAQQQPANNNEMVFQLLGLHWSHGPQAQLTEFARKLSRAQRPDGGWAQLSGIESDAWATGSALYALHEAGAMRTTDEVYQRGVAFLLRTQFEDGSWWVRSRSWPFQPHFNGQFPHGKDQWISQGATAWAAMALLFTLEPHVPAAPAPTGQQLIAAFTNSPAAQRRKMDDVTTAASATVEFTRDIQPLLERSCVGCHGGEKPRGGFRLASRELLLKGGQSGEPAIAPGSADDSPLIQYVSGKIEDLEMPPLDRREKYPALTAAEIDRLRRWIDSGAPWPAAAGEAVKPRAQALEE